MSPNQGSLFVDVGSELRMMIRNRRQRLAALNAFLAERNLRPRHVLGDKETGEVEIIGVYRVVCHTPQYHQDFFYACLLPNGNIRQLPVRYNANGAVSDGAVIVPIINDNYLAFVRQWRHPLGRYTLELPRGFTEPGDFQHLTGMDIGHHRVRLPGMLTALRESMEELGLNDRMTIQSMTTLGSVPMDTGTSAGEPDYIILHLRTGSDPAKLLVPQDQEVQRVQIARFCEIADMIDRGELRDNFTFSALLLLHRHMRRSERQGFSESLPSSPPLGPSWIGR